MDLEFIYQELQKEDVKLSTIYSYSHPIKTNGKIKNISIGRIWFNLLLPDNYPLIDEQVDKKKINNILKDISEKYEALEITTIYNNIQREAFKMSSILPTSMNIDDFILNDESEINRQTLFEKDLNIVDFQTQSTNIASKHLDNLGEKDSQLYKIIKSGAASNVGDINNLMVARGITIDIEENIHSPIKKSLNDGLSPEEYYKQARESRRVYYIRSKGAADPGYLARKVVFANANTQLGSNDCKTTKYLEIKIRGDMQKYLIGRYYLNNKGDLEVISKDTPDLSNTVIKLRSPIYCKESNNNICKKCYGELINKYNTKNIGIYTANVINVVGVESYAMKSRHLSSQVNFKPVNFLTDLITI